MSRITNPQSHQTADCKIGNLYLWADHIFWIRSVINKTAPFYGDFHQLIHRRTIFNKIFLLEKFINYGLQIIHQLSTRRFRRIWQVSIEKKYMKRMWDLWFSSIFAVFLRISLIQTYGRTSKNRLCWLAAYYGQFRRNFKFNVEGFLRHFFKFQRWQKCAKSQIFTRHRFC